MYKQLNEILFAFYVLKTVTKRLTVQKQFCAAFDFVSENLTIDNIKRSRSFYVNVYTSSNYLFEFVFYVRQKEIDFANIFIFV